MIKPPKTGARPWCRTSFGIPQRITVDFYDSVSREVAGVNEGGGFVRLPLSKFSETLWSKDGKDVVPW